MRVTNTMMANNMMRNLTKNLTRMENLQQQMASGKKFSRPSDNPIGVSRSLRLNTEVATMAQYKRNADDTQSWLDTTEMAINNINEILKRANELAVEAATETNSLSERQTIAGEITELRNQLVQIGNTDYAGSYIFSGYKTDKPLLTSAGKYDLGGGAVLTLDEVININIGMGDKIGMNSVGQRIFGLYVPQTPPNTADLDLMTADTLKQESLKGKNLDPAANNIIISAGAQTLNITYGGTSYPITIDAGTYNNFTDLTDEINDAITDAGAPLMGNVAVTEVNNTLVFQSNSSKFSVSSGTLSAATLGLTNGQASVSSVSSGNQSQLIAIFDQLITDLNANSTTGISNAISRIDKQSTNINAIRAEIGVKSNRIELTTNRILDDTLNLKELLSKNEDADMAEVIMNIKMEENVYQASLSTGAKIIQPSLIDFLR